MSFSKSFKASIFACSVAFTTAARIDDRNSGLRADDQNHAAAFVQSAMAPDTKEEMSVFDAARLGRPDILQLLYERDPDIINKIDDFDNSTVAHLAAAFGHLNVLKWIGQQKECAHLISAKDEDGQTIAHRAARMGKLEVLQWIELKYAQLLSVKDDDGQTPVHLAARRGKVEVLQLICKRKDAAQLLIVEDNRGQTVAHHAARTGQLDVLQFLYNNGVDVFSVKNRDGKTPCDLAGRKRFFKRKDGVHKWLIEENNKRISQASNVLLEEGKMPDVLVDY